MIKEELLRPRYKVMMDYPKSPFKVGQIVELKQGGLPSMPSDIWHTGFLPEIKDEGDYGHFVYAEPYFSNFPQIFQQLIWYELREIPDLPEYLMNVMHESKYVIKVVKYEPYYSGGDIEIPHDSFYAYIDEKRYDPLIYFNPATEEEYNEYLKRCNEQLK